MFLASPSPLPHPYLILTSPYFNLILTFTYLPRDVTLSHLCLIPSPYFHVPLFLFTLPLPNPHSLIPVTLPSSHPTVLLFHLAHDTHYVLDHHHHHHRHPPPVPSLPST